MAQTRFIWANLFYDPKIKNWYMQSINFWTRTVWNKFTVSPYYGTIAVPLVQGVGLCPLCVKTLNYTVQLDKNSFLKISEDEKSQNKNNQLLILFYVDILFIINKMNMTNTKQYKRQYREMPQATKDKIAAKLRGRKLSDEPKKRISDGQKRAWAQIPQRQGFNDLWPTQQDNNENEQGNGAEKESKL